MAARTAHALRARPDAVHRPKSRNARTITMLQAPRTRFAGLETSLSKGKLMIVDATLSHLLRATSGMPTKHEPSSARLPRRGEKVFAVMP